MTLLESFIVALICISIVFLVLAVLYGILMLFSTATKLLAARDSGSDVNIGTGDTKALKREELNSEEGNLKLYKADEPTAALIMAIVSHESKIPLSNLRFKSIKKVK